MVRELGLLVAIYCQLPSVTKQIHVNTECVCETDVSLDVPQYMCGRLRAHVVVTCIATGHM